MSKLIDHALNATTSLRVLGSAGILRPYGPRTLAGLGRTVLRWGVGPAGGFMTLAIRHPNRVGLVDDLGELTFAELHTRSNALARGLARLGVAEGDAIAVMCRNHRGFIDATIAGTKLGADILYLNTAFAGPQLVDVIEREKPAVVIHDEEFTSVLAGVGDAQRVIGWSDGSDHGGAPTIESLIAANDQADGVPPERHSRIVILTSGTTGTPKGAARSEAGIDAAVALLSRMPLRTGWRTHIAAPLFHTWGFAHFALAMLLGSTVVLRRHFDPEDVLRVVEENRCQSLVAIPVMLQRILRLDESVLSRHTLPNVKVVASSGSALPGELALTWMDHFGDNLYNIYGSTEVAWATIATPADLRTAPTSAGKPPYRTVVRLFDDADRPVPTGEVGRIFVGNSLLFEGYSGGGSKAMIGDLMSTGDVGRFDADGRLYVEGRDDEMIVSGGENVFPKEVEDCLVAHAGVVEAAAVGIEDPEFGMRLRAFVCVNAVVTEDELKDHVRANLARFKVPKQIVVIPELPRNATGKILKRELASWNEEA